MSEIFVEQATRLVGLDLCWSVPYVLRCLPHGQKTLMVPLGRRARERIMPVMHWLRVGSGIQKQEVALDRPIIGESALPQPPRPIRVQMRMQVEMGALPIPNHRPACLDR